MTSDQEERLVVALENIGLGLKYLGNGDAGTSMGAIEAHSVQVQEGASSIAGALSEIARAIDAVSETRGNHN